MRIHIEFHKTIMKYIQDFKNKNDIKMSTIEATKKLNDKIVSIGGIVVD